MGLLWAYDSLVDVTKCCNFAFQLLLEHNGQFPRKLLLPRVKKTANTSRNIDSVRLRLNASEYTMTDKTLHNERVPSQRRN